MSSNVAGSLKIVLLLNVVIPYVVNVPDIITLLPKLALLLIMVPFTVKLLYIKTFDKNDA